MGQARIAIENEIRGRLVGLGHVLRHLRHAPLRGHEEVAAVLVQRAVEEREEGGLAGAVAPHQADFLAGMDGGGDVFQQDLSTAAQGDVFEGDHGQNVDLTAYQFQPL